ncbi:unnamed protein product [Blumeria hordei]|uniref:Aminodeoxychorismate lyase n=1 Tax=Blumeria hordei TaxID=2867405 RepID=A0A383USB7_BLUHO|nr:unnamed protein product [Blumeria hordei]
MAKPDFQIFSTLRYDTNLAHSPANALLTPSLIKSLRYHCFYMPIHHRDRLVEAANYFGWTHAADKLKGEEGLAFLLSNLGEEILTEIGTDGSPSLPLRVKVLLDHDGNLTIEKSTTSPVSLDNLYPPCLLGPEVDSTIVKSGMRGQLSEKVVDPSSPIYTIHVSQIYVVAGPHNSYKTTHREDYDNARREKGILDMTELREVLLVDHRGQVIEGSLTSVYFFRDGNWVTPTLELGGVKGTTRRWALSQGLCTESVILASSLSEGEQCWISNGLRGFQRGVISL